MKLSNVNHTPEHVTGIIGENKMPVIIAKSISYIYQMNERMNGELHCDALTWKDKIEFSLIESLLLDLPLSDVQRSDLDKIHIRFGWISKEMQQLEWVKIGVLLEGYLNDKHSPTERNKFQQICRTIGISMRVMSVRRKLRRLENLKKTAA